MNFNNNIIEEIKKIKEEKEVLILAHYYQEAIIQDVADFVGDSLGLAQKAAETKQKNILFAGVHFMAETAKIINPEAKIIIPDPNAGCSLADSCSPEEFKKFIDKHKDHTVITYINSTAAIKTMTDIVCTSGNAVQIVNSLPKEEKIIFAPDKNLGAYINKETNREMLLWNGTCVVHDQLKAEKAIRLKKQHPDAKFIAHPECSAAILILADFIGSTTAMLKFTQKDKTKKYIVATETGILHPMKEASPKKEFILLPSEENYACNDCLEMKKITLEKILYSLKTLIPEVKLDKEIMEKARKPIQRMLDISYQLNII
jgi:quinolinate synthase